MYLYLYIDIYRHTYIRTYIRTYVPDIGLHDLVYYNLLHQSTTLYFDYTILPTDRLYIPDIGLHPGPLHRPGARGGADQISDNASLT